MSAIEAEEEAEEGVVEQLKQGEDMVSCVAVIFFCPTLTILSKAC